MQSLNISLICLVFVAVLNVNVIAGLLKQGVAVKGKFLCGDVAERANSTRVRIDDIDWGLDPDDVLDDKFVDNDRGEYSLKGFTHEVTPIDPVLYVWTKCNNASSSQYRKIKFVLPKKNIIKEEPQNNNEYIDMGVINLQTVFDKEKQESIDK